MPRSVYSHNNRLIVRAFESIGIGNFARRRKAAGSAPRKAFLEALSKAMKGLATAMTPSGVLVQRRAATSECAGAEYRG
jgi:hypothetical protein